MTSQPLNLAIAPSVPVSIEAASGNRGQVAEVVVEPTPPANELIDRSIRAGIARWTGGLSPAALALAFADWQVHVAASPARRLTLTQEAIGEALRFAEMLVTLRPAFRPWGMIEPSSNDHRFVDPDWKLPAFNYLAQAFLLGEQWWHLATTDVSGLSRSNAAIVDFAIRQCLDTIAPSNFPFSNPAILRKIMESGGGNFISGLHNWLEDWTTLIAGRPHPDPNFAVGKSVATAKGKIVFRNELIELIQYAPTTPNVRPEPVLIVPAWIMKYYILDLSPHNSLVQFLVENGFTVFMISWRNPMPDDRDLGLEDYRKLGVDAAIAAINKRLPGRSIHATGYCLGGTLLSIAAARLCKENPELLRSITLLAAQTDFTEAGELTLFINESQVSFLEDMMWQRGVLETRQMAGAFQMLRSNDLIWSRVVRDYLIGERAPPSDLMAWNADATRMPYRMHSEYLRQLFLNNDLAEGRYSVDGQPIALSDLRAPMFVVGTLRDHVAPWRSVYKIHFQSDANITFVLASGGHNAGIVAPPNEEDHSYQVREKAENGPYLGPDEWLKEALHREGSWWPEWTRFLVAHSGEPIPAQGTTEAKDASLGDAPGRYVLER
jgi:polyhydroxyalkanoate synthase subunit PhaC